MASAPRGYQFHEWFAVTGNDDLLARKSTMHQVGQLCLRLCDIDLLHVPPPRVTTITLVGQPDSRNPRCSECARSMDPADKKSAKCLRSLPTSVRSLITEASPSSDTQARRRTRDAMAALSERATAQGGFVRSKGALSPVTRARGRARRCHPRKWPSKRDFGPFWGVFPLRINNPSRSDPERAQDPFAPRLKAPRCSQCLPEALRLIR